MIALPERKAWAEYVVCKTEHCFVIPDDMSFNEAVALTVDGIVAYVLLFEMGGLKAGNDPCGLNARRKNILMHSAAGSLVSITRLQTFPQFTNTLFGLDRYGDSNASKRTECSPF